ncbi:hypothetical protein TWF730_010129 [Orbilia blumenaviensis]|uniref:Uncharacterized protein n=1 Tax=Orbilia blumenaviensis TaxID=1796055 RepID=A0AAV9UTP0_9PEZI
MGQHPTFRKNVTRAVPERSRRFIKKYLVAEIDRQDVKDVIEFMEERAEIHNEIVEWNCQDYCLEALEGLRENFLISDDDENYEDGIGKTKEYYGPG